MARKGKSAMTAQPSGVLEQETVVQEVPLGVSTPAKHSRKGQVGTAADQVGQDADALLATSGFSDSLADRIKSGIGRRKATKTTKTKTDVGAAAVNALSDIINAMIMPGQDSTERYLDSRDADCSVPADIPGASHEQVQHANQPARRPTAHAGYASDDGPFGTQQSIVQTPEPKSRKSVKRGQSKAAETAMLQAASELADGSDVCEDKLREDEKVCCCAGH